ncbi:MAG TPA: metal ABC transporter permease, partial [Magnetospirillaceae bacterium]|nr:metal ABC transporter permease [Magnetospirillaceae bacterium]
NEQLWWLLGIGAVACLALAVMYRPLLFASVDPEVARAKGVPMRLISIFFLLVLAVAVTEAAQVVGTLLVLSLAIAPAAAAARLSVKLSTVMALSVSFAVFTSVGGVVLSLLFDTIKPSVFITMFSFVLYVVVRIITLPTNRTTPDPK